MGYARMFEEREQGPHIARLPRDRQQSGLSVEKGVERLRAHSAFFDQVKHDRRVQVAAAGRHISIRSAWCRNMF